jgi:hypothetical protein
MSDFKRVLVSSPTAAAKNYCFESWIDNVMGFSYPEFDIALYDNTEDGGKNCEYLNSYVKNNYGSLHNFKAVNSLIKHNEKISSVIAKLCLSHNDCRGNTLIGGYDYLFHLETDVFPPKDVIERLMFRGKNVIGGVYDIDSGKHRVPMITERIEIKKNYVSVFWTGRHGNNVRLFDGNIHEVAQIGLGCVLISKKALERITFRYDPNRNCHPDTFFSEDCAKKKIPTHIDTSIVCRHENVAWGVYGLDYK